MRALSLIVFVFAAVSALFPVPAVSQSADGKKGGPEQPVIVNGDTVEYVAERSEITATGNVRVDYKGTRLSCHRLTVNTVTKDSVAEGNVLIEDPNGTMRGDRIVYNFNTKKGSADNGSASSPPFYTRAPVIAMKDGNEYVARGGWATTCSYDKPHWRLRTSTVNMTAGDRIRTYDNTLLIGDLPCMYLPYYTQSLDDPIMHVSLVPGYRKEWGAFLLSSYRYYLTESVTGRLYLDYRDRLGLAEGVGVNYVTPSLGRGDAKAYYTYERPARESLGAPGEFERWFLRWQHRLDIDPQTYYISQFYRVYDEKREVRGSEYNFLKDYFPREYERESRPLSYAQIHRTFDRASLDVLAQARSSKWYEQVERLPEVRYTLPNITLTEGAFPLYFEDVTQAAYLQKRVGSPAATGSEYSAARFDTYNELQTPFKLGFVDVAPFTAMRNTVYSSGADEKHVDPRTVLYAGTSASTRFYRIYETKPGFLGMYIDDIRHIVAPTLTYSYNPEPTVKSSRLKQFDDIDRIGENSSVALALSNRLQTKRAGAAVDFLDFRIDTSYIFRSVDPLTDAVVRNRLSDIIGLELEFYPYSWLSLTADSDYDHRGDYFSNANYDVVFRLMPGRSIGFGQRYERKGGSEFTAGLDWLLTPKWSFHAYQRYQIRENASEPQGMVRQEYGFTRDLHCWLMDMTFSYEKEHGSSVWFVFRLKAFPEAQVSFSQSYNAPRAGDK